MRRILLAAALLLALLLVARFATMSARSRGPGGERTAPEVLADCPDRPNCVASVASDPERRVPPLTYEGAPEKAIEALRRIVESMPGARSVEVDGRYLRAEFVSRLFRFVDDLELLADPEKGEIQVRSASRVGRSDLGVNRRRVGRLRELWRAASR